MLQLHPTLALCCDITVTHRTGSQHSPQAKHCTTNHGIPFKQCNGWEQRSAASMWSSRPPQRWREAGLEAPRPHNSSLSSHGATSFGSLLHIWIINNKDNENHTCVRILKMVFRSKSVFSLIPYFHATLNPERNVHMLFNMNALPATLHITCFSIISKRRIEKPSTPSTWIFLIEVRKFVGIDQGRISHQVN